MQKFSQYHNSCKKTTQTRTCEFFRKFGLSHETTDPADSRPETTE